MKQAWNRWSLRVPSLVASSGAARYTVYPSTRQKLAEEKVQKHTNRTPRAARCPKPVLVSRRPPSKEPATAEASVVFCVPHVRHGILCGRRGIMRGVRGILCGCSYVCTCMCASMHARRNARLKCTVKRRTMYTVYRVRFRTKRGTWRTYTGYTRALDARTLWHEAVPPAPMRCRDPESPYHYTILESGVPTKGAALALEALHSARAIAADPSTARGGPWSRPTLSTCQIDVARAAAKLRSLQCLADLAACDKRGSLYRHLLDLDFDAPDTATAQNPVVRGAVIRRKQNSGCRNRALYLSSATAQKRFVKSAKGKAFISCKLEQWACDGESGAGQRPLTLA